MSSLCQSFVQIGHRTSRDLRHAWAADLSFGEETITETNLLALKRRHPGNVVLRSFTKHKEAINGADWEWWFLDRVKQTGFPMRVQAKRLIKNSHIFRGLLDRKNATTPGFQIDALIANANRDNMLPIHCFYLDENVMARSVLGYRRRLGLQSFEHEFGCWVGLSTRIKQEQKKSLYGLQSYIFPWHLLTCSNGSKARQALSLPRRVYETLRRPPGSVLENRDADVEIPQVVEKLPMYVLELLDLGLSARSSYQLLERDIRGIALFSEPQGATT